MVKKQKRKTKKIGCIKINMDRGKKFLYLNKFLFVMVFVFGVFYVATINDLSIKGFVLQELKTEAQKLNNENRNIELMVMELESYDNIAKRANELSMVRVDKIDYISINNEDVAMK